MENQNQINPETAAGQQPTAEPEIPAMYQSLIADEQADSPDEDEDLDDLFHPRMTQNSFFETDNWSI